MVCPDRCHPKEELGQNAYVCGSIQAKQVVQRERYPSTTPAEAVADIAQAKAKYFTVFDALKGYQCPLDEASQNLTTFITPFGHFKYLRAPYGISSISEHYNRRTDEAFVGMHNFRKMVDDVVIFDEDKSEHIKHVRQFLHRCEEKNITLNSSLDSAKLR